MKKFFLSLVAVFAALSMFGQAQLSLRFVDANGDRVQKIEATLGEAFDAPRLVFDPAEAENYVRIEYSSTNPEVAEIDMVSGLVTLKAEGSTTIRAVSGENEWYYTARAQYNLAVVSSTPPVGPTCPEARWNLPADNVLTLEVGDVVSIPELMGATGSILYLNAKTIENVLVAELTEDDLIHATGPGTARFIGMHIEASEGETLQCEYGFDILVREGKPQKKSPELSWSDTLVYAELGVPCKAPILSNPHDVPMNKIESYNPNVADISPDGKVLTINGIGEAVIFAESFDTEEYFAESVSFRVRVHSLGLRVKGINVTSANAEDVLGDGSHNVTFEVESRTLHLNSWNVDASELPGLDAMIVDEGAGEGALPLTIVLHGRNVIVNADMSIRADNVPVVIMGESTRDALEMAANTVAVVAPYFKIHQCAVTANAAAAGIKAGVELGVSIGSHLLAVSKGLAIQTPQLIMADGEEGVAILTPGVRFEPKKGFLTKDNEYAKEVEIGKVPVVVPDDQVTTIDFTQTDPEGNESVVFSTSANDIYNEATGQLEISTSLTDEQVAEALENLVPGSSAWVAALPGSIVFDIPAGEGVLKVKCMTLPGYKLQVMIEGEAAVSVEMESLGWAKVTYNVAAPMHVVIYLHAESGSPAPARIATSLKDAPVAHAYIEAIEIAPKDAPQGIENLDAESLENGSKLLIDGQLYIIREGRIFNANGAQVQ